MAQFGGSGSGARWLFILSQENISWPSAGHKAPCGRHMLAFGGEPVYVGVWRAKTRLCCGLAGATQTRLCWGLTCPNLLMMRFGTRGPSTLMLQFGGRPVWRVPVAYVRGWAAIWGAEILEGQQALQKRPAKKKLVSKVLPPNPTNHSIVPVVAGCC